MTDKKMKKDREIVMELETQIKEIRHQLNEQLRCLDQRLESHYCMVWELQDFYQRRAELELDYARNLDKLVKQIMLRHRADKQRREQWPAYSTYKMWQTLLGITTKQSRHHNILADTYSNIVSSKFNYLLEDMQRIYKKCREIAVCAHDEMTKVATELHSSMKTYHSYHEMCRQSQTKLERVQSQRDRVGQDSKKSTLSKRVIRYEKQTEKHLHKYSESNVKATKSRNDYIMSMVSANAAIRKFFVDDLPELINTMDYGFHISLGQIMMIAVTCEQHTCNSQLDSLEMLSAKAKDLNQREDRQAFLQQFHQIFSLPKKFEFQPHKGDPENEVNAHGTVGEDLTERFRTITDRLHGLKVESDELWKTLDSADSALLERLTVVDVDVPSLFQADKEQTKTAAEVEKQRTERLETEAFYLNKFCTYQLLANLIARLQAKCSVIEKALVRCNGGELSPSDLQRKRPASVSTKRKRTLGKSTLETRPKLFGGSIEEYVQATGQEIPSIVISCVRIINLYGMHHQGVFRVSGLQHEINEFRNQFERGEEPLLGKTDGRDINSVAGVLKLYFRELREPLFPLQLFDELIACSKYDVSDPDQLKKCILRLQELILPLPRPIVVVSRYLFAFLNHLSELSDENMMDAHNLAVCFGPTLLPMPPDHDQVRYQNNVNELIRILIVYNEKIFPNDGGLIYEKCMIEEEGDVEDSLDSLLEDAGIEGTGSEDDLDSVDKEAVVLFDFQARNTKELSLKKGDSILLTTRINNDWWKGSCAGHSGLIPNSYIALQPRINLDRASSVPDGRTHMSTESLPAKSFGAMHSSTALPNVGDGELLDRSISQPNICGGSKLTAPVPASPTVLASCSSTSSDLSRGGYASADSLGSMSSKEDTIAPPVVDDDSLLVKSLTDSASGSLNADTSGVAAEEDSDKCLSLSVSLEPTPDLVLHLPSASQPVSVRPLSPPLTTAEVFASAEHGTIKKGGLGGRTASVGDAGSGVDEVFPGTPVEISTALESDTFSFDMLPPPPPMLDICQPSVSIDLPGTSSDNKDGQEDPVELAINVTDSESMPVSDVIYPGDILADLPLPPPPDPSDFDYTTLIDDPTIPGPNSWTNDDEAISLGLPSPQAAGFSITSSPLSSVPEESVDSIPADDTRSLHGQENDFKPIAFDTAPITCNEPLHDTGSGLSPEVIRGDSYMGDGSLPDLLPAPVTSGECTVSQQVSVTVSNTDALHTTTTAAHSSTSLESPVPCTSFDRSFGSISQPGASPDSSQSALSQLVLATHKHGTSLAHPVFAESILHRPAPALLAHAAALELLSQQPETAGSGFEKVDAGGKHDGHHGDKPKSKPPPVKKKPMAASKDKSGS